MNTLVFLPKGFILLEFSMFTDVMGWARDDFEHATHVTTCGFNKEVISTFGVPVIVDMLIDEVNIDDYDALAIPGGFEECGFYQDVYNDKFLDLIREFDLRGKFIATICVGALALGKSGVLKGRKATTYHCKGGYRQKQLEAFGAELVNEPIVVDKNVITSNSPEAGIHATFKLLEMLTSKEEMEMVKASMGY